MADLVEMAKSLAMVSAREAMDCSMVGDSVLGGIMMERESNESTK